MSDALSELAAGASNQSPDAAAPGVAPSGLFKLPRELRDKVSRRGEVDSCMIANAITQIYAYLVQPLHSKEGRQLAGNLLLVNLQIYHEASEFLHKNFAFILISFTTDIAAANVIKDYLKHAVPVKRTLNRKTYSRNGYIAYISLTNPNFRHLQYTDSFMLLIDDRSANNFEGFLMDIAEDQRCSRNPISMPLRRYEIVVEMLQNEEADPSIVRRIQNSWLASFRRAWWDFRDFTIEHALDAGLVNEIEAAVQGRLWELPDEFFAKLNACHRDGVKAYIAGDLETAAFQWRSGLSYCRLQVASDQFEEWCIDGRPREIYDRVDKYDFIMRLKLTECLLKQALKPGVTYAHHETWSRNAYCMAMSSSLGGWAQNRFYRPSSKEQERFALFRSIAYILAGKWEEAAKEIPILSRTTRQTMREIVSSKRIIRAELFGLLTAQ